MVNKLAFTPVNLVREHHFLLLRQYLNPEDGVWLDEMAHDPSKVGKVRRELNTELSLPAKDKM